MGAAAIIGLIGLGISIIKGGFDLNSYYEQKQAAEDAKDAQKEAFQKQQKQKAHQAALSKALNQQKAKKMRAQMGAKVFDTICAAEKAEFKQSRIQRRGYYNYGTPWASPIC